MKLSSHLDHWSGLCVMLAGALALLACDDGEADDGAAGSAASSGAAGIGGTAGVVSGSGGQGGTAGEPPKVSCSAPLPDPGDDACLACALEHCCHNGSCYSPSSVQERAGGIADAPGRCYVEHVGCIKDCHEQARGASEQSSWEIVADCERQCAGRDESEGYFPSAMTTHPVLCLIGGYPNDSDAGVDADDAGTASPEQVCPWPECDDPVSPCAELCFPGFR